MTFKLKPGEPAFEPVDGPFAGRRYVQDFVYMEIPLGEEHRFERADQATVTSLPAKERKPPKAQIADERA